MAQPPTGEQPQPPTGEQPQPPFGGQPASSDTWQPPGGASYGDQPQPPPYGSPPHGTGGYPSPPNPSNGFATAGIILAILVAPLGLIFSIIGLAKSGARAGAGRALSIVGIVVSVVLLGGTVVAVSVVATSSGADPGCVSAERIPGQMSSTVTADEAAISRDQTNVSALPADFQRFQTDLQAIQGKLAAAEVQATHPSVKARIAALDSDLSTVTSSLQALLQGDASQISRLETAASKLQGDGDALVSTCSSF